MIDKMPRRRRFIARIELEPRSQVGDNTCFVFRLFVYVTLLLFYANYGAGIYVCHKLSVRILCLFPRRCSNSFLLWVSSALLWVYGYSRSIFNLLLPAVRYRHLLRWPYHLAFLFYVSYTLVFLLW